MADDSTTSGTPIIVPADVRARFGAIVDLILESESMNDDERRYWIDILPVMTEEQIVKLREILVHEKEQLAAIDAKYAKDMTLIADAEAAKQMDLERRQKAIKRAQSEAEAQASDIETAEKLLDQIDQV